MLIPGLYKIGPEEQQSKAEGAILRDLNGYQVEDLIGIMYILRFDFCG